MLQYIYKGRFGQRIVYTLPGDREVLAVEGHILGSRWHETHLLRAFFPEFRRL